MLKDHTGYSEPYLQYGQIALFCYCKNSDLNISIYTHIISMGLNEFVAAVKTDKSTKKKYFLIISILLLLFIFFRNDGIYCFPTCMQVSF